MRKNRKLSWILTIAFVFSTIVSLPTFPVMAGCQDINGHWAKPQIEYLMAQKIINGYPDNTFKPENPISRAEFIVITNKAFNFSDSTAINYSDVNPTDWFAADIARAKAARYISGYEDGTMKPDQQISRQEAASIVARILALKSADTTATLQRFSDNETIANWSRDSIAAMVENGYLKGYPDNSFKPANSIKRAEAAVLFKIVLDRDQDDLTVEPKPEIQSLFDQAGTYGPKTGTQVINEDVTISASGVILQNIIIEKDLIIAKAVGDGDVTLNNVTVKGKTYVRGGGKDSIHINGGQYSEIIIEQTATGQVRIVAVDTSGLRVTISENAKGEEIILNGDFKSVTVNADNVNITTQGDTNIGEFRVQNGLQDVNIELSRDSTVNEMVLNSKTNVKGQGTIEKASGSKANDSSFATQPDSIITPGSGGGGGGGGSSAVAVSAISVSPTSLTLTAGGATGTLTPTVSPSDATNKSVTWSSSNTGVATVDATGKVTPVAAGTATITVKTEDGNFTAACEVTVEAAPIVLGSVATAAPTADGTGTGATNIGKYTVGTATGAAPNFATVITGIETLVDVVSADSKQGTAKWVGVLVTTDKEVTNLAVKTPSMTEFANLAQADINEAVAGGTTGTKTFVWWLKSEDIGSEGKNILIKVQGQDDSTAVKLNVTFNAYVVAPVSVTGVSLDQGTMTLTAGGATGTLVATVAPENATNKNVTWTSSDENVATVADGVVTPVAAGTATITVTTEDGSKTATCTVTVEAAPVSVTGVSLDQGTMTLTAGGATGTLVATVAPENATNKNVTWTSSDENVATVADGVVTPVAAGTATITVTTEDGSKTATCTVTVEAAPVSVTGVSLDQGTMTLTAGGATGTLVATVAPENATNKNVTWTSSDENVATVADGVVTPVAAGTATITVTTEDGSKTATCTVTVEAAPGITSVTVSPETATVAQGGTQQLTATVVAVGGAAQTVTWTSSDTGNKVTVDANGLVSVDADAAAGDYTITATSTVDTNKKDTATITVEELVDAVAPAITTDLTDKTTTVGSAVTLDATATVTDGGTISYQWYSATDADKTGAAAIDGQTNATYAPPVDAAGTFYYYCVVTNTNNAATGTKTATTTSAVAKVTVETVVDALALDTLVVAPVKHEAPNTTAIDATQYSGTIEWFEIDGSTPVTGNFAASKAYVAKVTLTAKPGYTLTGVAENSFTYTEASVVNAANAGVVRITFPATAPKLASTLAFADEGPVAKLTTDEAFANAATGDGEGAITYSSSDEAVATVDANTGEVTIVGAGSAVITASQAESATHEAGTASYTLNVTAPKSSEKAITGFSFQGLEPAVVGTIDEEAKTIALTVPYDTDVTALVATFTNSAKSAVKVGEVEQTSGTTTNNFTAPVTYTVIAEDETSATYTVTVTEAGDPLAAEKAAAALIDGKSVKVAFEKGEDKAAVLVAIKALDTTSNELIAALTEDAIAIAAGKATVTFADGVTAEVTVTEAADQAAINERLAITSVSIVDNKAYASTAAEGGTVRVLGYGVGINLDAKSEGKKISDTTSIVVELYKGETLLGQQTFKGFEKHAGASSTSGTIDAGGQYVATSWDNSWSAGIAEIPNKAVATVKYTDGTATAEMALNFTEEQTKIFYATEAVHALFEDVFAETLVLADGVTQDAINAASVLVEAVTVNPTQNKAALEGLITEAQALLGADQ